jgi:hypothetical protein
MLESRVDRDPIQPGRKLRVATKARQTLPGTDEEFLHDVIDIIRTGVIRATSAAIGR